MIASPVAEQLLTPENNGARHYFGFKVRAAAWVLVPRARKRPRDGLAIFNPQSLAGILKKVLASKGLWKGKRLYLREQVLREIEEVLEERIGLAPLRCAFYFRSPGLFSKTIALALDGNGRAIAYVKFGETPEGEMALTRETEALDRLASFPELANRVPRVIARARWREYPMLVVSVGTPLRRCSSFGPEHEAFLRDLREATASRKAFHDSVMWKVMAARFAANRATFSSDLCERYGGALGELERRMGNLQLTMSFAHRDFVPWNMHYDRGGMFFVYDWELAQDECTPGWDFFHYHLAGQPMRSGGRVQNLVEGLLGEAERAGIAPARDCLLAYLVDVGLFLRDRMQRSPGTVENTYVPLVEEIMDNLVRQESREPFACDTKLAAECAPQISSL